MLIPLTDDVDKRVMPVATTIIIALNLLIFVLEMRLAGEAPKGQKPKKLIEFIEAFGLAPVDLENGRYPPLFTHMFLHGGWSHFLGNMLVLWAFALTVESALGSFTFAVLYIFWGLVAAVAQSISAWGSNVPMIGASGAIAGVMGAYFIGFGARTRIKTLLFIFLRPTIIQVPATVYLLIWFGSQLLGWAEEDRRSAGQRGGIAWWAHLGGFIAGGLTMALVKRATVRTLVRDKSGELVFVESEEAQKAAVEKSRLLRWNKDVSPAAAAEPPRPTCTYCKTPLEQGDFIAANLAKCHNVDCQKLTYLS